MPQKWLAEVVWREPDGWFLTDWHGPPIRFLPLDDASVAVSGTLAADGTVELPTVTIERSPTR